MASGLYFLQHLWLSFWFHSKTLCRFNLFLTCALWNWEMRQGLENSPKTVEFLLTNSVITENSLDVPEAECSGLGSAWSWECGFSEASFLWMRRESSRAVVTHPWALLLVGSRQCEWRFCGCDGAWMTHWWGGHEQDSPSDATCHFHTIGLESPLHGGKIGRWCLSLSQGLQYRKAFSFSKTLRIPEGISN